MARRSSVERLARRAVRDQLLLTLAIAAVGGALVALSPREGRALLVFGSILMLLSPWISYAIIVKLYRPKIMNADEDQQS